MIRFENDYTTGAHPKILQRLIDTNEEQTTGYGLDPYSARARELIRDFCQNDSVDIHFLVGGTQTNKTVIASILRPYQGVIAAHTGHIAVHETGAIEATGHKVLTVTSADGKLTAAQVQAVIDEHETDGGRVHLVQPGMVYISHPAENGAIYSKAELQQLRDVCKKAGIPLFLDGARLGYGLAAAQSDVTMADIAALCDVFYIGGTKVGAMFGEAVVIVNPALKKDFRYMMKQNGALLAKGRLLGIQFEVLFEDGLYVDISRQAVEQAMRIRAAFVEKGFALYEDSVTNQQFVILPNAVIEQLQQTYSFAFWEKYDDEHRVVRFCTSWATKAEHVEQLVRDIKEL